MAKFLFFLLVKCALVIGAELIRHSANIYRWLYCVVSLYYCILCRDPRWEGIVARVVDCFLKLIVFCLRRVVGLCDRGHSAQRLQVSRSKHFKYRRACVTCLCVPSYIAVLTTVKSYNRKWGGDEANTCMKDLKHNITRSCSSIFC